MKKTIIAIVVVVLAIIGIVIFGRGSSNNPANSLGGGSNQPAVNGASPTPGTDTSMNCPALNGMDARGLSVKVFILDVSVVILRTSASIYEYGLLQLIMRRLIPFSCDNTF